MSDINLEFKYAVEDLMKMFSVSGETVRRWCRNEQIKYVKLPGTKGKYRFTQKAIEDFLDEYGSNDYPVKETLFGKKEDK